MQQSVHQFNGLGELFHVTDTITPLANKVNCVCLLTFLIDSIKYIVNKAQADAVDDVGVVAVAIQSHTL